MKSEKNYSVRSLIIYIQQKICSCNQVKMVRDVLRMSAGEQRTAYGIFIIRLEGKESLARPRL